MIVKATLARRPGPRLLILKRVCFFLEAGNSESLAPLAPGPLKALLYVLLAQRSLSDLFVRSFARLVVAE